MVEELWAKKTVLVVDDYAAIRHTVSGLLSSLGLVPSEAENGVEATAILRDRTFDLVVTDLVMPEMDGFELTESLRAVAKWRKLPIVVISTHDDARHVFRALRLGADDYLVKPPSADMARTVLARLFDHQWK
jgi:CheY-like chemotaxis protein